jgi:hypothetical protein
MIIFAIPPMRCAIAKRISGLLTVRQNDHGLWSNGFLESVICATEADFHSVPQYRPPPGCPSTQFATIRSRHKMGALSKIKADPELRAFVVARIHAMTFAELAA